MAQRNDEHESGAAGARSRSGGARHASPSARTSTILSGARDVRIADSTLTIVGGDVYNYNIHNPSERPRDIWAILKSIPNFRKIYQDMLVKATEGTGMWLVRGDKFRVWLEPNGDIKIFWGSGIPGAGKTLLASIVIEHLEALRQSSDAEICVCYVYFRYSDRSEVTVRNILETLVKQTLERHPGCLSVIDKTYTQHLREGTEPTEAQLLALLRELADNMSCTFYILDALDEAPTRIQLPVVRALASLNVKLFITSRPLKTVEAHFPQAYTFPITAQDIDIDLHITKGIDENAELQRLLLASPLLRDEIFSTIKQNCGGMFLHASLQLDALHDCINADQVRRRLKGFPSRIEDVYLQTWDRILAQSADLVSVAKAVLVWVLHAARSMTVEELERAVATSPDTHRFEPDRIVPCTTLMSLCRGLISLEEESRIVRLVHYTAKETLETLLHESFPHPHSVLAAVCITHLTECGFQNTIISSERGFRAALNRDPLLSYASQAWAFHAGKSLDVDVSKQRTTQFVNESKAFPAFTSLYRDRRLDILTPLHIVGLYHLPLALITDAIRGNPNVMTGLTQQSPLMVASGSGHEDLVAHLITLSAIEANLVNNHGSSALVLAANAGHKAVVKLILSHPKIQVNIVDSYGWSALMAAVSQGNKGLAKLLLAHPEIQVNIVNKRGWSALIWAAYKGDECMVEQLLAHPDIQINLVDNDNWSALMLASQMGHEGVVNLLLAHPEVRVNLINNDGWSALTLSAGEGYEGVTRLLLAHPKIQVNMVNNNGWSVLMEATREGHEDPAKLILAHPEVQVNMVDNRGWSALIWAAYGDNEGIAELLLAYPNISINLVDNDNCSALMLAAQWGREGTAKLLLAHPEVQVNLVNNDGWSALMLAAQWGREGAAKLLLAHPEVQVNLVNNGGWSALILSAQWGHEGAAKLLLTHPEIQVNLVNNDGWSALMGAASKGHEGVARLLLAHPDIQVNLASNHGSTALLLAAERGYIEIVDLLLTTGAFDVNAFDDDRDTAIKMAADEGHEAIVRLFLDTPNVDTTIRSLTDGHTAMSAAQANGHRIIAELLQDFESQNRLITSPHEISQLSLHNQDGSDSDSDGAYHDAEEWSEGDAC